MSRERRKQLVLAAGYRYLGSETDWRTTHPSGTGGEAEIVAWADSEVAKRLVQVYADSEVAKAVDGSVVVGEISEERVVAGLAVLATFIGGDGVKAREARRIAQRARELTGEM